jgi:hypothetical protein
LPEEGETTEMTSAKPKVKDKWFAKCSLCGIEKQLSTVQLSEPKLYTLWLRRMCDDCRNQVFFHFFTGLGFKKTAQMFRKIRRKRK